MILSTVIRRRAGYIGTLAGGAIVGGWGVFALSGAVIKDAKPDASENSEVVVVESANGNVMHANGRVQVFTTKEGNTFAFRANSGEDGAWTSDSRTLSEPLHHMIALAKTAPSAARLQSLMEQNPAADLDEDGTLSRVEYDAFYTALALRDPARVLTEFPEVDRDGDAVLSSAEAARWVTGTNFTGPQAHAVFLPESPAADGLPKPMVVVARAGDAVEAESTFVWNMSTDAMDESAAFAVTGDGAAPRVMTWSSADGNGAEAKIELLPNADVQNVIIRRNDGLDGGQSGMLVKVVPQNDAAEGEIKLKVEMEGIGDDAIPQPAIIRMRANGAAPTELQMFEGIAGGCLKPELLQTRVSVTGWLDENVAFSPTSAEIAACLVEVENAPRALFLELNPDADADGDGVLTDDEKQEFLDVRMSELHNKLMGTVGQVPHVAHDILRRIHEFHGTSGVGSSETQAGGSGNPGRLKTVVIENGQVRVNGELVDVDHLPEGVQVRIIEQDGNK